MRPDQPAGGAQQRPLVRTVGAEGAVIGPGAPDDEVSLLEVLSVLVRHWRIVLGLPAVVALVAAVVALVLPSKFDSTVAFVPETSPTTQLPSSLAGLAGQFGISLGLGSSQSPRFYAALVRSRGITSQILLSFYPDPRPSTASGDSVRLLTLLEVRGKNSADSLQRGIKALARVTSVDVDAQTGVLTLSVRTRYPAISAAVANRFVDFLNDFNARSRQTQAGERRKFVEGRVAAGEAALREAEENLKTFYQSNRSWQQAPQLVFEEGRLRRQVDVQQEVYLTLKREYERARIEEVNDTPVLTTIDRAVPSVRRAAPQRSVIVLSAFSLALVVAMFWAFTREYFDKVRRQETLAYESFRALVGQMRRDLRLTRAPAQGPHE